jgi:hypothetical protein
MKKNMHMKYLRECKRSRVSVAAGGFGGSLPDSPHACPLLPQKSSGSGSSSDTLWSSRPLQPSRLPASAAEEQRQRQQQQQRPHCGLRARFARAPSSPFYDPLPPHTGNFFVPPAIRLQPQMSIFFVIASLARTPG